MEKALPVLGAVLVGVMVAAAIVGTRPTTSEPLTVGEIEALGERASVQCAALCVAVTNSHPYAAELFSEWRVDFQETSPGRWRPTCNCGWVPVP